MLKRNRLMCVVLPLFFVSPSTLTPFHNQAWQLIENKADNKEMVQDLRLKKFQELFEKDKLKIEKNKVEEPKINDLEKTKENNIEWQEFIVTFYTGLEEENSIHGNVDCKGRPLERGVIANNILPLGTKIFLEKDYGIRTVSDKGGNNFNSSNHIDMYVERWNGETREQWKKRANSYGVKKLKGYILK